MIGEHNSRLKEMLALKSGGIKTKEERVFKYLLDNEDRIQELSISDIAENADVSKATVVRFCKSLEFNGLKDFKVWYEAGKGAKFSPTKVIKGDEDKSTVLAIYKEGINGTIERTFSKENVAVLETMVESIKTNDEIALVGFDSELLYADRLMQIIKRRFPEKKITLNGDKEKPLPYMVIFSFSGLEKNTVEYLTNAVIAGNKVTAITSCETSLIGKAASDALIISDDLILNEDEHLLGRLSLLSVLGYIEIMLERK